MRTLPKPAVILPSTLAGLVNGRLPASLLEPTTFGNAVAERTAARAFRAFAAVEVRPRRIDPRHVGGYRSLYEQWTIFGGNAARYEPCNAVVYAATPSSRRKSWPAAARARVQAELRTAGYSVVIPDATYWRKIRRADGSYPATAAIPMTSNHGYGLAVDIAEERDGDPAPESISAALVDLLVARGHLYGLGAELDSEVWHWRYFAGDNVPAAVLAYEGTITDEPDYPHATIRAGSTGWDVVKFQQHNNDWHASGACPERLAVDGVAGPATVRAIRAWQRALGLDDDGVYGPFTAAKYRAVLIDIARAKAAA